MHNVFCFHQGWRFRAADTFPMAKALEECRDGAGHLPVDPDYDDGDWIQVTLPHTFNGPDLFSVPIEDAGSGQRRTCAFYRNTLEIFPEHAGKLVFMTFEGVRQACYLYVNGRLAGYYESGVGPFGFDLTAFLHSSGKNSIAVVTDNTSTRNTPFCIAETPNAPGAVPGSFLQGQDEPVPPGLEEGVGFQWNCNDFNPSVGGLSVPVRIVFKDKLHLTLPLYANLQSIGAYIYADGFDFEKKTARIHVEAEIRNLSDKPADCRVLARILCPDGRETACFVSEEKTIRPAKDYSPRLSLVPEDAYRFDPESGRWAPLEEAEVRPTCIASAGTETIRFSAPVSGLAFWNPACPALYRVELILTENGEERDRDEIITGFRKTGYDPDRGILINGSPVWLRGRLFGNWI